MPRMLIAYFSAGGNTASMAEAIGEGARKVEGLTVEVRSVEELDPDDLLDYDAIVMGSPVYYGTMAGPLKQFIDESVRHHGKLEGKLGGAFSSAGVVGGGFETTNLDILKCLLVHGMVVKGASSGPHYGPVSHGAPDAETRDRCVEYGTMMGELCLKMFG